jgi:hypothetical protein
MSLLTDKKYKLASSVKFDEYMKAIGEYENLYTWKGINKFYFCILEVFVFPLYKLFEFYYLLVPWK